MILMNISSSQLVAISPSGGLTASILALSDVNGGKEKKYYLRIFDNEKQKESRIIDLGAAKKHGMVHVGNNFAALRWSNDETRLLYVAEKPAKPPSGYFDADLEWKDDEKMKKADVGNKFKWTESWGEQNPDCRQPGTNPCFDSVRYNRSNTVICIVDFTKKDPNEQIQVVDAVPENLSPMEV